MLNATGGVTNAGDPCGALGGGGGGWRCSCAGGQRAAGRRQQTGTSAGARLGACGTRIGDDVEPHCSHVVVECWEALTASNLGEKAHAMRGAKTLFPRGLRCVWLLLGLLEDFWKNGIEANGPGSSAFLSGLAIHQRVTRSSSAVPLSCSHTYHFICEFVKTSYASPQPAWRAFRVGTE
jgi:hypothetical protein